MGAKKAIASPKEDPSRRCDKQKGEQDIGDAKESEDVRLDGAVNVLMRFPSTMHLCVPPGIPCSKLDTFIHMYETHCKNLLRAVSSSVLDDVPVHMSHFWNEVPVHLSPILDNEFVASVLETCDILFYEVCWPCALTPMPTACCE